MSGTAIDVARIYQGAVVIDGSVAPEIDDAYLDRLRRSGVTAVNLTVPDVHADLARCLREIAATLDLIAAHRDVLTLIRSVADIRAAKRDGKVGIIIGPQNALPCAEGMHLFRVLRELGVMIMQLTYNERNVFGDGVVVPDAGGLTPLGREAVAEMNRVGMLIDLSHCSDRTTNEAIEASRVPVAITHANAHALHPSPRNKKDETLKLLASRGGVIGVTLWSPMLRYDRQPDLDDFVRHLSHVADLVGIEHVAIGSDQSEGNPRDQWELDFGPNGRYPTVTRQMGAWYAYDTRFAANGFSVSDFPAIARAVAALGLSERELAGVLGGNLLRVCEQAWEAGGA